MGQGVTIGPKSNENSVDTLENGVNKVPKCIKCVLESQWAREVLVVEVKSLGGHRLQGKSHKGVPSAIKIALFFVELELFFVELPPITSIMGTVGVKTLFGTCIGKTPNIYDGWWMG